MIKKKRGPARGSKTTGGRKTTRLREEDAVHAIRKLIKSMNMDAEQKITLEDGINNLANEVESMIGRIDMAATTTARKNLLVAYKKFLEQNIEVVNQLLKTKD